MYEKLADLLLYGRLEGDGAVLTELGDLWRDWQRGGAPREELLRRAHGLARRLLELAVGWGLDGNLWQGYLTYVLIGDENPYTLSVERREDGGGTLSQLARRDLAIFRQLFTLDFGPLETELGTDCFSALCRYQAPAGTEREPGRTVEKLAGALAGAASDEEFFQRLTEFYRRRGLGQLGLYRAFRVRETERGEAALEPVADGEEMTLDGLVGCQVQKEELLANTRALLRGLPCNDVLLYGDAGTGKSSSVRALLPEFARDGLRMIELHKHQLRLLAPAIAAVRDRNYAFILFIDDLSFEESEVEYKFLKSVMDGGLASRPGNVRIYATSNRRHLIRETWKDRGDMEYENEVHRSDTMEEKLSLAARFGVSICYNTPNRQEYHDIVRALAARQLSTDMSQEELLLLADRWEIRHGGVSGRTAQQFIHYLAGGNRYGNPG